MIEKEFNAICSFRQSHPPIRGKAISTNSELAKPVFANLDALRSKLENRFKNYKGVDLKFEYSKGASNFPNILHVSILPPEQKVSNGIYVVICFDKLGRGALVGCAESKTNPKGLNVIKRKRYSYKELIIDVDGATSNTKYNNVFANPKEFYYELTDDKELFDHLEDSLDLILFKLNFTDGSNLSVKDLVTSNSFSAPFAPGNIDDGRKKIAREITIRQGQQKFRNDVLKAYNYTCAISDSEIQPVLEAAHILPYKGKETNHIQNGILLRADLHTLFDMHLISIDPFTTKVYFDESLLKDSEYKRFNGRKLNLPIQSHLRPSQEALIFRKNAKNKFNSLNIIEVVCGIIFKDDLVLICRRKAEKSLGGYWEFPGGKVEQAESYENSLIRELMEELNLTVNIKKHFFNTVHHYNKGAIELISFICEAENIATESTDHDQLEWVKVSDLLNWELAPADIPIAKELIEEFKS